MAEASAAPNENPELVAMADALPAVLAEYVAARDNVKAIVAEWSPKWPVPSADIIRFAEGCKEYRGIDGSGLEMALYPTRIKMMPRLGTAEYFEVSAAHHGSEAKRCAAFKRERRMLSNLRAAEQERALIKPARIYWSEVDRITAASGIEAAQARAGAAQDALKAAVDRIMRADDRTITGAVIKAPALHAWTEVELFYRTLNDRGPAWAEQLAAPIVKHAS